MFRPCARAGRVIDELERFTGRGWMSASSSDLKFVIFRDLKDGYRWRLSSPTGETVDECEQEVYRLKGNRYPSAKVRDTAIG